MILLKKIRFIFARKQKINFLILLILTFGGAIAETIGVTLIIPFISIALDPTYIFRQPILSYFYDLLKINNENYFLMILTICLIAIYITKSIYLVFMYKLQFRFVYNNQRLLSVRLMNCYLKKDYEYHLMKNSSEMIQGVTQDISRLFSLVLSVALVATEIMVIFCMTIVLIVINPYMTMLAILFLFIILYVFLNRHRKILKEAGIVNQKSYEAMIKWIGQGIGGIKEIKLARKEDFFVEAYSGSAKEYADAQRESSLLGQLPRLLIEAICICGILFSVFIMLYLGVDMLEMIPQMSVFAMVAFRIMPSLNRIAAYHNTIIFNKPSIDLVYNELKNSEIELEKEKMGSVGDREIDLTDIKVENLYYKYPNTESYILEDVSIELPIKKSIAFIGASGAGKTTFIDIFLGILKPTSGEITVGSVNVHKHFKAWSEKLAYVPQNIYLCDDTIRRNIAFGVKDKDIDESKINTALEKSQLREFVKGLPKGVNTEIGERGVRLSGGQRQRIGIARAFYNDADIIVLDEATSALDNDTEIDIMKAVDAIKGEKTLIIIAHRLSTISNCDLVFKIEGGKVKCESFDIN